jgi:hypothetical protein
MRIRCTRKLATKIKIDLPDLTTEVPLSSEWNANLIRHEGIQYIVALDSGTLASVLFPGKGIVSANDLADAMRSAIMKMFKRNGWLFTLGRYVDFDHLQPEILPTAEKTVIGSLTEMVRLIRGHLEYGDSDIDAIVDQVNRAPMSLIGMKAPEWLLDDLSKKAPNEI